MFFSELLLLSLEKFDKKLGKARALKILFKSDLIGLKCVSIDFKV